MCALQLLAHSLGETRAENIRINTTNQHKDKMNYSMGWLALFIFYFLGLVRFNVEAIHLTFNLLKKSYGILSYVVRSFSFTHLLFFSLAFNCFTLVICVTFM